MKRAAKGTWVITGAASGFGREFARRLAERGEPLALWDRDAAGLEETADQVDARTQCFTVDVTDPEACERAARETRGALGAIAHVVHCAGVLRTGPVEAMSAEDFALMTNVNFLGTVHVTKAVLPQLTRAEGRATLMLVASVAGLRGLPELAGYCASKAAVIGFAEGLRDELKGTRVDLRVICPPPADTPMVTNLPSLPPVYRLSRRFTAEEVVERSLASLERRPWLVLLDAMSKTMRTANALAPSVVDLVIRSAERLPSRD